MHKKDNLEFIEHHYKIKNYIKNTRNMEIMMAIDTNTIFDLFDFLFNKQEFIDLLYLIDRSLPQNYFDFKTTRQIKKNLKLIFKTNLYSKTQFLMLVFRYIKVKSFHPYSNSGENKTILTNMRRTFWR